MDPAQLLNPKAYAKQQKAKKRMPNYGPKQTKKAKTDNDSEVKVNIPTYDPRALLNPKAGAKQAKMDDDPPPIHDDSMNGSSQSLGSSQAVSNPSSIYEKLHNLENRDSIRTTKRKATTPAEAEDEEISKKQKSTFDGASRGSVLSENLRKEREKLAANGPNTSIDLTAENDNDNEVMIVSGPDDEVCLGCLTVKVNCTVVPAVGNSTLSKLDNNWWPPIRVRISRQTDVNTIIDVVDGTKKVFGRVDPLVAVAIVPMLDGAHVSKLRVKAHLVRRKKAANEKVGDAISKAMNMELTIYAPRSRAFAFGRWLSRKQLWLSNPAIVEHGKEIHNPHDLRPNHAPRPLPAAFTTDRNGVGSTSAVSIVQRTVQEMRQEASSLFDQIISNDGLQEMEADPNIISTDLMSHQKQALKFLIEHEVHDFTSSDHTPGTDEKQPSTLWKSHIKKDGSRAWYNIITGHEVATKPEHTRGGILADMMGMGKTLSILALVATTKPQAQAFRKAKVPNSTTLPIEVNSRATLLVCPKSVLTNWQEQINAHTNPGQLTFLVYHGPGRTQDLHELATKDVILTSYGTIANEAFAGPKKKNALTKINWFRIVLDEAHFIRNAKTAAAKAACMLEAERRWAVTGTPIQNRLEDLGTLVKFIRVKPFDEETAWSRYLTSRFKLQNTEALTHLKILVQSITLRRAKDSVGMAIKLEEDVYLDFSPEERSLYTAFALQSKTKINSMYLNASSKGRAHSQVLKHMLRLRLICAHGQQMLSAEDLEEIRGIDEGNAIDLGDEPQSEHGKFTTEKSAYEHLNLLVDAGSDTCQECLESLTRERSSEEDQDVNPLDDKVRPSDADEVISIASDSDEDEKEPPELLGLLTPCFHLLHTKCRAAHQKRVDESRKTDNFHECQYCQAHVRDDYFELTQTGLDKYKADQALKRRSNKQALFDPATYAPHTKVLRLIHDLRESARETEKLPEGEPPIRSIVFSEWTTYLDLIGHALNEHNIPYVRLDGTMTLKARAEVLHRFKSDPEIVVFLVSIRAGGTGLNFTAANKVYLMEPQYNPGVEAQAVDRVHRLGQLRNVHITRYIMQDSLEQGMLELQEKKKKLAVMSLEKKLSADDEAKNRLQELRDLFK